ncbi:MAG: PHP domain-containing protein, partial [Halobacteriaceae archaeon]
KHQVHCIAEFSHLGWENTYKKIDRVLLSGMEPTHPRHVAYDGRFDAVAEY